MSFSIGDGPRRRKWTEACRIDTITQQPITRYYNDEK